MLAMLLSLPLWFQYGFLFVFGAIMGSFLDVVALRFHTGKSINGRSRCLSCGQDLRWFELFPVISYLVQSGRCLRCRAHIPVRLLLVEVLTGGLFVLAYVNSYTLIELLLHVALVWTLLLIVLYDQRHLIIPDVLTIGVAVLTVVLLYEHGLFMAVDWLMLIQVACGVGAAGFYASLWLISRGRWIGLGDAKLALPLGCLLSPAGAFSFVVLSFWVGAFISVLLLLIQYVAKRGQMRLRIFGQPLTIKSEVPFAPYLITAFILVYFCHVDVLALMMYWFYGS